MHKVDPGLSSGEMVARLMGFLRLPTTWQEMLKVSVTYCSASLTFGDDVLANVSSIDHQQNSTVIKCPENLTLDRIPVDFKATRTVSAGQSLQYQQSKMELLHIDMEPTSKVRKFSFMYYASSK